MSRMADAVEALRLPSRFRAATINSQALVGQLARRWMIVPLTLSLFAGYATLFESATDSPAFRTVLSLAPSWAWGGAWIGLAVCAVTTLRFGFVSTYAITNVGTLFMGLAYGGSITAAKLFNGLPVTYTVVGVFAFMVGASAFSVVMPYSVATPASAPPAKRS